MIAEPSRPEHQCGACGRGHFVPVPFCPFCGARQGTPPCDAPSDTRQAIGPDRASPPDAASTPPAIETAPPSRPRPDAPGQPRPHPAVRTSLPSRRSLRLRHVLLAALMVGALADLALERRKGAPAPWQIAIGPAWTSLALAPLQVAPQLRLSGDGTFSLRIDGTRVVRVAPEEGITIGTPYLRSLELRAARPVVITLTPQRD